MKTQPKNLRVLVRQTLRELSNNPDMASVVRVCRRSIKTLNQPGEPWSALTVSIIADKLYEAASQQGDVSLWNEGGQGYRAMRYIRNWLAENEEGGAHD